MRGLITGPGRCWLPVLAIAITLAGCRQQMADQPRQSPLSPSPLFADGRSARPRIQGTVARGELALDDLSVDETSSRFPIAVTMELMERGRQRFEIYCSVCHGLVGDGDGMIPRRGFRHPPTFHSDRLRSAPVGHFFDVITNGIGVMPRYGTDIAPQDRWAIIAYVRALQLSQYVQASRLPAEDQQRLTEGGTQ